MSSNFSYKGVSVSNIVTSNGNATVSGFAGMPAIPLGGSNYNGMKPLTFGYTSGTPPVDICNQYIAQSNLITSSTNVNIPSGAKSCRVISIGGGGGSGGSGGYGSAKSYYNSNNAKGNGGDGGSGGYGQYTYGAINLAGYGFNYITVTVGGPGNNGSNGDNKSQNMAKGTTKGNYGSSGNTGAPSYVVPTGPAATAYFGQQAYANGGNGGGGGEGGSGTVNSNGNTNSNKGSDGSAGTPDSSQAYDGNYPALSNYGNPGTQGAVQIIWLYN